MLKQTYPTAGETAEEMDYQADIVHWCAVTVKDCWYHSVAVLVYVEDCNRYDYYYYYSY